MTSLVKRSDVPHDVVTDPDEVATNMAELNKFRGKEMYVLLSDDCTDIELIACQISYDVPFYVAMSGLFPESATKSSMYFLHAKVADPANLPYEMDDGEEAFVIYDEWDYRQFSSMEGVADAIEQMFRIYRNTNIDKDFAVLIGQELHSGLLDFLLERADRWKKQKKLSSSKTKYSP